MQEAPGKTQTQKGNPQRIETGIDNLGKIKLGKSTAMIELNLDRDIKTQEKFLQVQWW